MKKKLIIQEQFSKDSRFYVNEKDTERIFQAPIYKYKICRVKLSYIKKGIKGKIISLYETESYKFLNGEINEEQYEKYCKNETHEYENHSKDSFDGLINKFKQYDLKDMAIVVDQFGLIRDGQHRASILLKKYGPNYEIDVVKVYYKGLHIKKRIKLIIKFLKQILSFRSQ